MDLISQLPDDVVDKILCSLPLLDAVKTCVLAKAWRHKCFKLSKLQFDYAFWQEALQGKEGGTDWSVIIVTNVMSQHMGTLDELHLHFLSSSHVKTEDINPLMFSALQKGVKKLCLKGYAVPASGYSCTQLTHLELTAYNSPFSLPASFEGLPNLVSLELDSYGSDADDADKITHLISYCPKITRVSLYINADKDLQFRSATLEYLSLDGNLSFINFQKIENLKELVIGLSDVDYISFGETYEKMNIFFSGLVKLERLKMDSCSLQLLFTYGLPAPRRLSTMLGKLKILWIGPIDLHNFDVLRVLLCLLASSPKLRELKIDTHLGAYLEGGEEMNIAAYIDSYQDQKFENLHIVKILTEGRVVDLMMIDFLLGSSPNLELMSIDYPSKDIDLVNLFLKKVTRFTRASSKASVQFL